MPGDKGVVCNEDGGAVVGWECAAMINATRTRKTMAITCNAERSILRLNACFMPTPFEVKLTIEKTACWNSRADEIYGGSHHGNVRPGWPS